MRRFSIDFGTLHGFWSPEQEGLRLLSGSIGEPKKDDRTERVPYSSVTYDYSDIFPPSYSERELQYRLDLLSADRRNAQFILAQIRKRLRWQGLRDLYDSAFPDYHFEVRAPEIKAEDDQHTVQIITVTFRANPAMLPNQVPALLSSEQRYPDLDGDGHVTAADAAIILTAAEKIARGESSGLTPEQLLLADADIDGSVTESDSLLVLQYAAAVSRGEFADSMQSWQKYLRRHLSMKGALY